MRVVEALLKAGAPRVSSEVVRVAEALRADPVAGLTRLVRLLRAPTLDGATPHERLAALESLRVGWRAAIDPMLVSLRNRPIPLDRDELTSFHRVGLALRALRDAYQGVHQACHDGGTVPGPPAPLAVARSLEAQSRLLVAACRLRIALPRDDWDAVCRLVIPLRTAAALDEPFPDPSSAVRQESPRVAFVLPMLLRLLEPLGLPAAQLDISGVLARRLAGGVGIRIDVDGLPHVSADGPALVLSAHHSVRLDTRAALERLQSVRQRLAQGESRASLGLRTPLTPTALDALLASLATVWCPYHVPMPLARPPVALALMHVGLPTEPRSEGGSASGLAARSEGDRNSLPGRSPYVYGGRPAAGAAGVSPYLYGRAAEAAYAEPGSRRTPAPPAEQLAAVRSELTRQTMQALASPVEWLGQDARRAVFARIDAQPRLVLGQLVAVLPVRALERAGRRGGLRSIVPSPIPLRLGRVATLAQTGAADGREAFAHDVGVVFWPGAAVPARVRFEDSSAFEQAWWIPDSSEQGPAALVVRRDRVEPPCNVVVREGPHEVEARVLRILERGQGFDRLEVSPG
jgi:hypothetical protein